MVRFIPLKDLVKEIKNKGLLRWIDKLKFRHILLVYVLIVASFGYIYFHFQDPNHYLFYLAKNQKVDVIQDAVYFSFVAATTTGFGDIIPFGYFKVIAVIEVVAGFMLLATVTSKLVSIKQDVILEELYELSITEKLNRLRSSFLLFRQNVDRIMSKIEDKSIQKRDVDNLYLYLSAFEDTLNETQTLIIKPENRIVIKEIDAVNTELIFNSIVNSFDKFLELINLLRQNKIEWRREVTINLIDTCISLNENLFTNLNNSSKLIRQKLNDLNARKISIIENIKNETHPKRKI